VVGFAACWQPTLRAVLLLVYRTRLQQIDLPDLPIYVWSNVLWYLHEWGDLAFLRVLDAGSPTEFVLPLPLVFHRNLIGYDELVAAVREWSHRAETHAHLYEQQYGVPPPTAFHDEPPLNVLRDEMETYRAILPRTWHTRDDTFIDPRTSAAIRRVDGTPPPHPEQPPASWWCWSGGQGDLPGHGWVEQWSAYSVGAGSHQYHLWGPLVFLLLLCIHRPEGSYLDAVLGGGFDRTVRRNLAILVIAAVARLSPETVFDGITMAQHGRYHFDETPWIEPPLWAEWMGPGPILRRVEGEWVLSEGTRELVVAWPEGEGGGNPRSHPWFIAFAFRERAADWAVQWEYTHSI
jgi:hypothetical protein